MRVRAFAKINLSLRVLGVRADGYHELRTIFQSIALHDTMTIRAARGPFRLNCDNPDCPSNDTNLIWRAAARLWTASGRRGAVRDISIDLVKRIPLQAGLGGGSSDAAAALRALGQLWRVDEPRLRATAAELGADVPYFLEGGTALGLERGDLLFPLIDYPAAWVVLVLPRFRVSTKEAFAWWDASQHAVFGRRFQGRHPRGAPVLRQTHPSTRLGVTLSLSKGQGTPSLSRSDRGALRMSEMLNDLEAPVAAHHPHITRLVRALQKTGALHAAMTGSGSAVFGLFARRSAAAAAARALRGPVSPPLVTLVTRTVNRMQYRALARM